MIRIEKVVQLHRVDGGRNGQNGRAPRPAPSCADRLERFRRRVFAPVGRQGRGIDDFDAAGVRNLELDDREVGGQQIGIGVNEKLEDRERGRRRRVDDRDAGRIPASASEAGAFAIER